MSDLSYYCPLKNYSDKRHGLVLSGIMHQVDKPVCFIGDEAGYFFSMVRRIDYPSIVFDNHIFYAYYYLLKQDIGQFKKYIKQYYSLYKPELFEHFEKRVYDEKNSYLKCMVLMVLTNISENIDSELCNFQEDKVGNVEEKIRNLNKYYIQNNELYYREVPEGTFNIVFEKKPVGTEGILISKRSHPDYHLSSEVGDYKYYYYQQE